jgi:hypothetical protein
MDELFSGFSRGIGLWNPPGTSSAELTEQIARLARGIARFEIVKLALAEQKHLATALPPGPLAGEALYRAVVDAARTAITRHPLAATNEKKHKAETMGILREQGIQSKGGFGRHVDKALALPEFKSKRGPVGVTHKSLARKTDR